MPYGDPDPTDPMTLHGVEFPTDDAEAMRDMASCYIEEYFRLGLSPQAVASMFERGEFAGPTMALRQLGRETVSQMIAEQAVLRGPRGGRVQVDQQSQGTLSLPVLER